MAIGVVSESSAVTVKGPIETPPPGHFDDLVVALKEALGPSLGLTSDDVYVKYLTRLMFDYDSRNGDWLKYTFGDASRGYTRNLVDEGNGKSNLLVLVWSPGKGSPIHDHGNAHFLKILRSELTETRYAFPQDGLKRSMHIVSEKTYKENAVTYMADELGLHRVSNRGSDFAVSLHLYTPPNVARGGCHIFDEKSGRSHVSGCPTTQYMVSYWKSRRTQLIGRSHISFVSFAEALLSC